MRGKLPEEFISVKEASSLLGCSQASIEVGLRNGTFPIGWAWDTREDGRSGQWNYRIPRAAFMTALETGVAVRRFADEYERRVILCGACFSPTQACRRNNTRKRG